MEKPEIVLDPGRCALLIIDMQNDFVSPGGYHHRQGRSCGPMQLIIPNIQLLLRSLPEEVKVIHVVTAREPDGSDNHWRFHRILPERVRVTGEARGHDCNALRGTWGAEIVDMLKPGLESHIVSKRRNSAFYETDLGMRLRCWGIDTLILTGVMAEVCVESTARDAFNRDYDIVVVSDGVASGKETVCKEMLNRMEASFGAVLPAAKIGELFLPACYPGRH
jgi:ureidoacrylate peracid hydrolase